MSFKNPNNRCSLSGYVATIGEFKDGQKSIDLEIGVSRPPQCKGGKPSSDYIPVYVNDPTIIKFIMENIKKGSIVNIKGELRKWNDGTFKIAAYEVLMKGSSWQN